MHKSKIFFINNIISFTRFYFFFILIKNQSIRQAYLCVKRFTLKIGSKLHYIVVFSLTDKFLHPRCSNSKTHWAFKFKKRPAQNKKSGLWPNKKNIYMFFIFIFLLLVLLFFAYTLMYNECTYYILLLYKRIIGKSFHS